MPAVRTTQRRANAEAALGEIQSVAHGAADSVIGRPADIFLADAALQHEVFDEAADGIVRERGDDRGVHSKAALESAGDVVFAAAFPGAEVARGGNALVAGIEAQHDFAQAHQVPHAFAFWLDVQFRHDSRLNR